MTTDLDKMVAVLDQGDCLAAVSLIRVFVKTASERRHYEQLCGYPSEYGGDEEVLEFATMFLLHLAAKVIRSE